MWKCDNQLRTKSEKKKTVVEKKAEYPSKLEENENMSENKKQCKGRLYIVFTNILERK